MSHLVALVDHYNHELSRILDKHALEERQVTLRKPTPCTLKNKKDEGLREDGEKNDNLLMKMHLKDKRTELMLC